MEEADAMEGRPTEENPVEAVEALRERQVLLEHLSGIQRAVVAQRPLHEIYDSVIQCGCELLGDEVGVLQLRDPDTHRLNVVASYGLGAEFLTARARAGAPGLGARAMREGRLVRVDRGTDAVLESPQEWALEGLRAGIAAPLIGRGEVVGSLGIGTRNPDRRYASRDEQVVLALAELATLARNHAQALGDAVHEALHDQLTGLPNRNLFLDRVDHALARAERQDAGIGVLVIDIDDFKTINDSLGHASGDELLTQVARRLEGRLRPADTIARLGGDEFAVLLEEVAAADEAALTADRLLKALEVPFELGAREVSVKASVGIAVGTTDAGTMLRDADLAMYRAKSDGRGRYEAFEPGMHREIMERLELEVELKGAIERGELTLLYQPIFSLRTGAVAGLEALVRWRHPTRGLVGPNRFIPLAERSGRIEDISRWVLTAAAHQGALWRAKYPGLPGLQVGVNISGSQLRNDGFAQEVAGILERAQLEPEGLTLEITETALMEDFERAVRRLDELTHLGVEVAVDDFGTGHSSLRYLQRLPLNNLKIAKPFVDEIESAESRPRILRAVLDLADVFELIPVAEGIERAEQAPVLLELGCELGQGHHLSEPITPGEADDLILRTGLLGGPAPPQEAEGDGESGAVSRRGSEAGPAAES